MRQSRDTTNGTKDTARRQTKENETIQRHGQMGQKTQHEDKQKKMKQSRDTGKWDKDTARRQTTGKTPNRKLKR